MNRRRLAVLGGCGILLALAGLIVAAPAVFGPLSPVLQGVIEPALGNTGLTLVLIGMATAAVGAIIASGTDSQEGVRPHFDTILSGVDSRASGADFDERLAHLDKTDTSDGGAGVEDELREEIRATAVTVLTRRTGVSVSEAREHLDSGQWTDDPQAAAFFTRRPPPIIVRLREWLSTQSGLEQRLDRVLAELEALMDNAGGERSEHDLGAESDEEGTRSPLSGPLDEVITHRVDVDSDQAITDDRVTASLRVPDHTEASAATTVVGPRRFGLAVGIASVAVGLLTGVTTPYLLGFLAVSYSITKYVTSTPEPRVEVTRTLGSDSPVPGDLVEVELTVENIGERPLPDLRVVDAPPDPLEVVEGSPSVCTSLQSGGTTTLRYTVRVKRGTFTFDATRVASRDLSNVRERAIEVSIPSRLTGATRLEDLPLETQASQRIGTVKTDQGGSGVEFYSTREYQPGDPMSRVNWNQLAKSGELTTVEFRQQRAPTVAIVLDQREAARVAPTEAALDGVDLSVYAAEQAFLTLLETGTDVGLLAYGERITDIEPGSDATQRALVQSRLRAATDRYAAALGEATIEAEAAVHQRLSPDPGMLDHHVPRNAQVLVLSPATDDFALEVTERLSAFGHPVTLLSPAVAGTDTIGARHRRLDRSCRLAAIRDHGTRVIDWQPDEPVGLAVSEATASVTRS